jgi:hypothetical protein
MSWARSRGMVRVVISFRQAVFRMFLIPIMMGWRELHTE